MLDNRSHRKSSCRVILTAMALVMGMGCEESGAPSATSGRVNSESQALSSDIFADGSYVLHEADEHDPLWKFHKSGVAVRLESDPSITSWGSDYWGYWDEPFELAGNVISYVAGGLTETTYEFIALSDGSIDVTKTVVVHPYLSGSTTTTVKHLGIYQPSGTSDPGQDGDDSDSDDTVDTSTGELEPTCDDRIENGGESDVDCGGTNCAGCEDGRACISASDCLSERCEEGICVVEMVGNIVADVTINADWGRGYCASIRITNESNAPTSSWSVVLDTKGGNIWSRWNGAFSGTSGEIMVTPLSWNVAIGAGQTTSQPGFCASKNGGGTAEVISATTQLR